MSEHNTNFYSLENIKETLKSCEDFLDNEEVYYHIGALRFAYDEIERLNNIIDELHILFIEFDRNVMRRKYVDANMINLEIKAKLKELKEGK